MRQTARSDDESWLVALSLLLLTGCGHESVHGPLEMLIDRAAESGLQFDHHNGMTGEYYFSEIVGAGSALFDYDNDGDLDVYLVQGSSLAPDAQVADPIRRDRLFRNELGTGESPESTRLEFTDVTAVSGLDSRGYGMGVATGDVNNDGWTDLYVTNFGANQMWLNGGRATDGGEVTFTDVTAESGTGDVRWSASAAFLDFDRDGWLDLFVTTYTDFRIANHKPCPNAQGAPEYCGPLAYRPQTDRLFRNLGAKSDSVSYEDVSATAGLLKAPGPGLGVVTVDVDGDGWVDVYVANDQAHNHLWMNQGDGTFRDEALLRGCAVDGQGRPQASMGVDAGDVDGDGDPDLFITHLVSEANTLYLNDGRGIFTERSAAMGLSVPSLGFTGFGTAFFDLDNDGWLDLFAVNGEVRTIREQRLAGERLPLRQPNQLFKNRGPTLGFEDWSGLVSSLGVALVSRGAAFGDIDNDGDTDVVVQNNNGPTRLMINQLGAAHSWLGLRLVGSSGRDMLGAQVTLLRPEEADISRRVGTDGSYLSANDPRLLFGLGSVSPTSVYGARVRWPSGRSERFDDLRLGRYQDLVEGQGASGETAP